MIFLLNGGDISDFSTHSASVSISSYLQKTALAASQKQRSKRDTDRVPKTGGHENLLHDEIHDFLAPTFKSVWDLMREFGQYCDVSNKLLVVYILKILKNGLSYQTVSDFKCNY